MKGLPVALMTAVLAAGLLISGCGQAAPAPTPTRAPAAPTKAAEPVKTAGPAVSTAASTKAAEPTKAPAAQPTASPARKVDFPQKGRSITLIVPWAPGGTTDIYGRTTAGFMEKELGVPIQIVNKPGAETQVGLTELATSKPDGYSLITVSVQSLVITSLDRERKAVYTPKSFQPVANQAYQPAVITVPASSPYKTVKDLVDVAKANPDKVKMGVAGWLVTPHIGVLKLEAASGARFATVLFPGTAPVMTALLGEHIDVGAISLPDVIQPTKAGQVRVLAIVGPRENKFLPGVKTLESQGYKVSALSNAGLAGPAGIPAEVVEVLAGAARKVSEIDEFKQKMESLGFDPQYVGPQDFASFWAEMEKDAPALLEQARKS